MTLHELNLLPREELVAALTKCCGSSRWVTKMLNFFPVEDFVELLEDAEEQWWSCSQQDWKEAFAHHPRIGDRESLEKKFGSTAQWAAAEQQQVQQASPEILDELARANEAYEQKFGYIFIVCATGKSAAEMLEMLKARLLNEPPVEIEIAADEQCSITKLRLEKLLS